MGFDVSYRSAEKISPALQREVLDALEVQTKRYSWVRVVYPNLALSRRFDIDWDIEHDYSEGTIGSIRHGVPDDAVKEFVDGYDFFLHQTDDEGFEIPDDN
jgi:hypothetical protein